ncbi:Acyl-coa--sterol o-acyltransferase [Thalictrum thalictroides]|uniref:Acyl-coa--sterol o-acyltransferase n=1 Tax=Thalictrum thalictroides TaxID=46969 RepID=A0A7J6WUD6_THATH|nr:Acyl-coa--sterol o-acyltransferase [Thalictrum thalictroides]
MVKTMVQSFLGLEIEPQFNKPYLASSLQDFWGKRWNLMVTSILRPSVYYPVVRVFSRWIGKSWAQKFGVFATFIVSGLMHELIFYYLGRVKPTWEVMLFFVLHGVCMAVEIAVKKILKDKWQLHPVVSTPLVIGFVVATGYWLFFPQLLRCDAVDRAVKEYAAVVEFMKNVGQIMMIYLAKIGVLSL